MKVLVTGGAGHLGQVTTRWLLERGWDVRVIDHAPSLDIAGIEYVSGEITHFDRVREAMRGCEAVIHLAALRSPSLGAAHEVFQVNVAGTFNVFEAASVEGVRRVAQASSINAIGCAWKLGDVAPEYFPIDEAHPKSTDDPYSFSKQMVEEIGDYYWRRDKIRSVSLRFPWVYPEGYLQSEAYTQRIQATRSLLDELVQLDEIERETRLSDVRQRALDFRATRPLESPNPVDRRQLSDPLWHTYTFDRFNFWTFVDVRDAAQALEKGVLAEYEGHHPLFVNDPLNWLDYDTHMLIQLFFPDVERTKGELSGSTSLVSADRARSLIGFEAAYSIAKL
jgi:nucleoside-diphosphate-sugar epimerase